MEVLGSRVLTAPCGWVTCVRSVSLLCVQEMTVVFMSV